VNVAPAVAAGLAILVSLPATAIDRIRIRAAEVQAAGQALQQVDATLAIDSATHSTLTASTGALPLPASVAAQTGPVRRLEVQCRDPVIQEPRLACPALRIGLSTARWGDLRVQSRVDYDMQRGQLVVSGTGPAIQGITPAVSARSTTTTKGTAGDAQVELPESTLAAWAKLLQPWMAGLPRDLT
jgi:hypothetical protein